MSIPTSFDPLGVRSSILPSGYTPLTAVRFENTPNEGSPPLEVYVDTGISFTMNTVLRVVASLPGYIDGWWYMGAFETQKAVQFGARLGLAAYMYQVSAPIGYSEAVHEFVIDGIARTSTVDGIVTQVELPMDYIPTNATLYIGGRHGVGAVSSGCPCVVYGVEISVDGRRVSVMIPALDSNGAACLYDTVRKRPFYSETSKQITPVL